MCRWSAVESNWLEVWALVQDAGRSAQFGSLGDRARTRADRSPGFRKKGRGDRALMALNENASVCLGASALFRAADCPISRITQGCDLRVPRRSTGLLGRLDPLTMTDLGPVRSSGSPCWNQVEESQIWIARQAGRANGINPAYYYDDLVQERGGNLPDFLKPI